MAMKSASDMLTVHSHTLEAMTKLFVCSSAGIPHFCFVYGSECAVYMLNVANQFCESWPLEQALEKGKLSSYRVECVVLFSAAL